KSNLRHNRRNTFRDRGFRANVKSLDCHQRGISSRLALENLVVVDKYDSAGKTLLHSPEYDIPKAEFHLLRLYGRDYDICGEGHRQLALDHFLHPITDDEPANDGTKEKRSDTEESCFHKKYSMD